MKSNIKVLEWTRKMGGAIRFVKKAMVVLLAVSPVLVPGVANAVYSGAGNGGGGSPGCPGPFSTCYGATWMYYDWSGIKSGAYESDGIYYNGNNSVTITGTTSNNRRFARGANINVDGNYGSCSDSDGGLWRYAMVAMYDYDYGSVENGFSAVGGKQAGVISMTGNDDSAYDLKFYNSSGWMNYYDGIGKSLDDAQVAYDYAYHTYEGEYNVLWDDVASGPSGRLGWFCAPENPKKEVNYYSVSNASNSVSGGAVSTGLNGAAPVKTVYTNNVVLTEKNQTISLTFSHNVYTTEKAEDVEYEITRTGFDSNGYSANPSYKANIDTYGDFVNEVNEMGGKYYVPNRSYSDGSSSFIDRTQYSMTFYADGEHVFCEMVSIEGTALTKACTRVVVMTGETTGQLCGNSALGLGPYTPSDGRTWVLSRAKDDTLAGTYGGWQPVIYVKPGNKVHWVNCYFPGAQYYANYNVTNVNGSDVAYHDTSHNTCYCTANGYKLFKDATGFQWLSKFKVSTTSSWGINGLEERWGFERIKSYGPFMVGDTQLQEVQNNYRVNYYSDVGYIPGFVDTITSDGATPITTRWRATNHSWTQMCSSCKCGCVTYTCSTKNGGTRTCRRCTGCPCSHTFSHCNSYNIGNYTTGTVTDKSNVYVPFNFINTVNIDVDRTLTYSGEEIGVTNGYVKVGTKSNDATEDTYATVVKNAHVKMVAFVSSSNSGSAGIRNTGDLCSLFSAKQCATVVDYTRDLNNSGTESSLSGTQTAEFNNTYNTFDASAGDYMCFAAAVYPATSGEDTNLYESGDGKWYVTAPKCAVIAKKPSMQVTGGSVFTNGSIRTNISSKHNLYNISGYQAIGGSTTSFGSWAEEAVIANGLVTKFASGAAIGRSDSGAGYGVSGFNFCGNGVPLSFANYTNSSGLFPDICGSLGANSTGNANISSSFISTNRAALVDYFATGNSSYSGDAYFILGDTWLGENVPSGTGKDIWYYNINGAANIMGGSLGKSTTRVVKAKSVNISQSIIYNATGLRMMGEVPKAVIYSAGDIHISCGVERVDAILIAEGTVYTCNSYTASGGNLNDYSRSINQLVINGAVIANQVELGRTYGNAAGDQSGTAAEVINYDTSSLIWSRSMAGAGESDTLTTVYVRELSPRY